MAEQSPNDLLTAFLEEHRLVLTIAPIFVPNQDGILAYSPELSRIVVSKRPEEPHGSSH